MTSEVRYQDDLYQAVNGAWMKQAVIPDDKSSTGGFQDLADEVEEKMMADFAAVSAGKKQAPDKYFAQAVTLYQQAKDFKTRDAAGFAPAEPRLNLVKGIKDLADYNQRAANLLQEHLIDPPFNFFVDVDMKDTSKNVINLMGPKTILPDTSYYAKDNQNGAQLLGIFKDMMQQLLAYTDLDEAAQKATLEGALAFDAEIAKHVKSSEEWADYPKAYNPTPTSTVIEKLKPFNFEDLLKTIFKNVPETIVVADPRFLNEFDQLFNEANFKLYRDWLYVITLGDVAGFLSEPLRQLSGTYNRALSGAPKSPDQLKHAYRVANRYFSEPIGIYYGRTYFGEKAKADVTQLVEKMIATYKQRLANSDWLSQPTKDKAILKLNKMVLKMGYPDHPEAIYDLLHVDPNRSLLENLFAMRKVQVQYNFDKLTKPVDRTVWNMPGHLVNASYDPSKNDITFPAAILQAPFYSLKQTASENLGGIGAVIAHEISHGFDNNGAQFDEYGNMANWWQKADFDHFHELTQAMIDEFDGLETAAGKVNGKLVVSENIADAGGLAAALDTAKREKDADLRAFFINWARIWRSKSRLERAKMLLAVDVHAPHELRANIQPRNLDDWYTTFDVQPGDGMYLPPEKRVQIW
ncbi:M13 family metallopeptidase [Lacticaseibacillus rhamnosus]|uniref:M13 family metallopeptidase n=1 Tax=Lacticaseibacillus rhamnosus TaxID=47715 RepID=UPI00232FD707|nr:M13-type metalloendopeptidase [Lacticaseibacillus rhamnosus]MDB7667352.1 M13 family peptidase [Lacticaseibacillus rhamnosus]